MSQNKKPIKMARVHTVTMKVVLMKRPSYFRCMKKSSTMLDLIDAISNVIQMFRLPSSIRDAQMVIAVRARSAKSTTSRCVYG